MLAFAAVAMVVSVAHADDAIARADLARAIQIYVSGDPVAARAALQSLLATGPSLPVEVRREALLWLGDILFAEGQKSSAREFFEALLDDDPHYPMDPVAHSAEVLAFYEELQSEHAEPEPPPPREDPLPPPRGPWPWTVLLPGGAYYFIEGQPAAGAVVGGLQAASLGASIGTWVELRRRVPETGEFPEGARGARSDFETLVWTNRAVGVAGYLAYAVPIVVETGNWMGGRRLTMTVGPQSVTFSGRF